MSDVFPPFDENQLSEEDLAVLRNFEAMEDWEFTTPVSPASPVWAEPTPGNTQDDEQFIDEIFTLFLTEVNDDIAIMLQALKQLEPMETIQPTRLSPIRRIGHKIRGTAGAMECHALETIAQHVETMVEQVDNGQLLPATALNGLQLAVMALENTLQSIAERTKEDEAPLAELEAGLAILNIPFEPAAFTANSSTEPEEAEKSPATQLAGEEDNDPFEDERTANISVYQPTPSAPQASTKPQPARKTPAAAQKAAAIPQKNSHFIRIDARRIEQLVQLSEQLAEQRTQLEGAQTRVKEAEEELLAAQNRLQQLEPMLPSLLLAYKPQRPAFEPATASLISRILSEAAQRQQSSRRVRGDERAGSQNKIRGRTRLIKAAGSAPWDELDMETYTEQDMLIRALCEAIADVNTAISRMRTAKAHLDMTMQKYIAHSMTLRNDILLLRLAPLRTLLPRLQRAIKMSVLAQERKVQFEVFGDTTEIDQDILDGLAALLLQLVRTCMAEPLSENEGSTRNKKPCRVWLRVEGRGNEILLEVGFSIAVRGGALDEVNEELQRLNGTITSQRNAQGGISFHLRIPRSYGTTRCLVVGVGQEQFIVPFSQIQRIDDSLFASFATGQHKNNHYRKQPDKIYRLNDLLGFANGAGDEQSALDRIRPMLVLPEGEDGAISGIAVDAVIGEAEFVIKTLPSYLQRPGIAGSATDDAGKNLLLIDFPDLTRHHTVLQFHTTRSKAVNQQTLSQQPRQPSILIADDSPTLRQSLKRSLKNAQFSLREARDGMEAWEQLKQDAPDVLLLDVEMPNLNGYDVLSLMHNRPEFVSVKTIMLTSRSSEKHSQRAIELGAHGYLTKPCAQDDLLKAIQAVLSDPSPT